MPVAGLAAKFSPMSRIAPPPLGIEITGSRGSPDGPTPRSSFPPEAAPPFHGAPGAGEASGDGQGPDLLAHSPEPPEPASLNGIIGLSTLAGRTLRR
ncbi:hypothetical protein GCM10017600_81980 [Streptosporangium carneum]|uniref:Uncharacterized protein n=1 Tax=Streptosporangium carneum TaxID=47481 RepID=A0A9W6MHZ3_9ACTN|nr:hypothetical protein GCM10017600_81980 [Streptosporangium carneum]